MLWLVIPTQNPSLKLTISLAPFPRASSVLEVNTIDLIAIECLRVFEPDWYRDIQ
jgi:hypothetical protein